jgi:hypothetical protein
MYILIALTETGIVMLIELLHDFDETACISTVNISG